MWYQQAPAGNRVLLKAQRDYRTALAQIFSPFEVSWYDSGTSALASAVRACVLKSKKNQPEVLIPAYACPALVSAIIYAGATPVLIDLQKDSTWMDLTLLEKAINEHTVAIIAVDLFGVQERGKPIRELIGAKSISLIEDSAQYFPRRPGAQVWFGDYIILSFGRGKPVSILNGGAVISRMGLEESPLAAVEGLLSKVKYYLKVKVYNALVSPSLYWIPSGLPILRLGATEFEALSSVNTLPDERLKYLPANIDEYLQSSNELAQKYEQLFSSNDGYRVPLNLGEINELSRFPILLPTKKQRDEAYRLLSQGGVGASCMYYCALPKVSSVPAEVSAQGPFPVASEFADRILTLPLHDRVTVKDIETVSRLVS